METIGEVTVDGRAVPIVLNGDLQRFEVRVGDEVALLALHRRGTVLSLNHTEVSSALRGRRIADALARAALEYARAHAMTVKPRCPFVAAFIGRHAEYQPLVDPSFRAEE
jgi:predicted GNAT family acetyltransferase